MAPSEAVITAWFGEHRTFLWGLCYRVTGSAADADDAVQETFVRAIEHAPATLQQPRYWLLKVAVNAARDLLRRRRRREYAGPWLPGPIDTSGAEPHLPSFERVIDGQQTLEGRYDLMESVSLAFLQALEALSPTQRAVFLLTDVFDYSAAEVARALDLSVANVRTIHHRARRAMQAYDKDRMIPTQERRRATAAALTRFLQLLNDADVAGIEEMLTSDVRVVTDGGGEVSASKRPIVGPTRVARFFVRLRESRSAFARTHVAEVNGFPAALVDFGAPMRRRPQRIVLSVAVDARGQLARFWVIATPQKLRSLPLSTETAPAASSTEWITG
jgi:RNA polymerase sigma-70 factor (ECF subfamily)